MGRQLHKLTAREVKALTNEGRYSDGGGLYLSVSSGGRRRWIFLYRWDGRTREMGLGSAQTVALAEARRAAEEARAKVKAGIDPVEDRKRQVPEHTVPTFGAFADELLDEIEHGFRNAKHRAQWRMTLTNYAAPLREKPVNEITTDDVLSVLKPIWRTKPETAARLRGRIERVLDAAKARGLRSGENPAGWRGHLKNLLPARQKLTRGHHAAMAFGDVPAFAARLRQRNGVSDRALEFCILTAARSGEVLGATWREIDTASAIWTIPALRMKAGREHRVPLSAGAMAILTQMAILGQEPDRYVFPGARPGRPLSVMAMDMVLRRMGQSVTVHGFRSSFRDWAGEATAFPREIAEAALAHAVGDQTERAYRRGDALEKRRRLMQDWGAFVSGPAAS